MNKEQFLTELREYLSILENQEQEDILAEYAQHIDMKMQKGLSEEEAIRDFSPIEQLAAEILEAYHVKPQFHMKETKTGQLTIKKAANAVAHGIGNVVHGIGNAFRWIGGKCCAFGNCVKRFFKSGNSKMAENSVNENANHSMNEKTVYSTNEKANRSTNEKTIRAEEMSAERTCRRQRSSGQIRRFGRACGRGLAMLWRWLAEACMWGLRFIWNAAWLLFTLFCAAMAMIVLMGIGAIPVLLYQGYPLVGIFMICLGGLLCFGALSYGAFGMLIRKNRCGQEGGRSCEEQRDVESGKEAVYEQTT